MKKYMPLFIFIGVMCVSGCASVENAGDTSPVQQQGSQIVQAIIAENYKDFIKGANDSSVAGNDAESFIESCKQLENTYGKPGSFRYLGELQTPLLVNQLYAVKFKKTGANGKYVDHEQLLQLIFGNENGSYKLLGIRFI